MKVGVFMGAFFPLLHSSYTQGKSIENKVASDKQNSTNLVYICEEVILKQIEITVCFKITKDFLKNVHIQYAGVHDQNICPSSINTLHSAIKKKNISIEMLSTLTPKCFQIAKIITCP